MPWACSTASYRKSRSWTRRGRSRRILANAPLAVAGTKESVLQGLLVDLKEAYKIESQISQRVFATEDAKEGPKAFAEKRKPNWQNK